MNEFLAALHKRQGISALALEFTVSNLCQNRRNIGCGME